MQLDHDCLLEISCYIVVIVNSIETAFISSIHMSKNVDCESLSPQIVHLPDCKLYGRCGLVSIHHPALYYLRHTLDFD